jgi:polyisoprenoid-binding protein YceI
MAGDDRPFYKRPRTWLIAIPVVLLLAVVGGPFVYINFIKEDAPDRLTLTEESSGENDPPAGDASTGDLDGVWTVGGGSLAGYRVKEVLFGQDTEAAGRTSDIKGSLTLDGTSVTTTEFTVAMDTVKSDESRRDAQFHGRIMDTARFPTATFVLTKPITLPSVPAQGETVTVDATGRFTIHGVTREVTFPIDAQRKAATIEVNGTIPVTFDDYGIPEPSFGPATVQDHGEIEFLLVFAKA